MKLKPCIYYLGLSCFPIAIMALLNIFYSFYFDYLLNVQTYIAVLFLSVIVGFNLYNFIHFGINFAGNISPPQEPCKFTPWCICKASICILHIFDVLLHWFYNPPNGGSRWPPSLPTVSHSAMLGRCCFQNDLQ